MKIQTCCVLFLGLILLGGCWDGTIPRDRESNEPRTMSEEIDRLREEAQKNDPERIREDSLCRELCARVDAHEPSVASVDSLLAAGANPNCECEVFHSRRRLGSRIPIIKDFMRRKNNTWETVESAVVIAVKEREEAITRALVKAGADLNQTGEDYGVPLNEVLGRKDADWADILLSLGADPKLVDLGLADHEKVVDRFLALGADPQNISFNGAIRNCDEGLVRKYFKLGVKPNKIDHFFLINFCNREGLLRTMLQLGMDPEVSNKNGGGTLLIKAIETGGLQQVDLILAAGADPNRLDQNGRSPLWMAISRSKERVVKLLLEMGAEPNPVLYEERNDENLMEKAIKRGSPEVVEIMQASGAQVRKEYGTNKDFAIQKGAGEDVLKVLN